MESLSYLPVEMDIDAMIAAKFPTKTPSLLLGFVHIRRTNKATEASSEDCNASYDIIIDLF
jgi:hypothetical protein